jgi:hypothetical protein
MTIWDTWGVSPAEPVLPSSLVILKVTLATREGEAWIPVCISQLEFKNQPRIGYIHRCPPCMNLGLKIVVYSTESTGTSTSAVNFMHLDSNNYQ